MRNKNFVGVFVAIIHRPARGAGDVLEVKIGAISEAHELFFAIRVGKHEVDGAFRIVGAVFGGNFFVAKIGGAKTHFLF